MVSLRILTDNSPRVAAFTGHGTARWIRLAYAATTDGDVKLYADDVDNEAVNEKDEETTRSRGSTVWNSLNPKIKDIIVKDARTRAIRQKKKREPADEKKRRLMMMWKKSQQEKKRASRVQRSIPLNNRTQLSDLEIGTEMTGTVISLTKFGAYVDVGTECDGLLHISQISNTFFVEHPRQVMSPGDEITVRVTSTSPEQKKLQLSMLPAEDANTQPDDDEDRIPLEDVDIDDELWGEIRRVTAYGAYVELGAVVDGFLHFMDHPSFADHVGETPNEFMHVGDRIRIWVSNLDYDKNRIQLTANRPAHLPGPRREIF